MKPIRKVMFLGSKPLGLKCLNTLWELAPEILCGVLSPDDRSDQRSALGGMEAFCSARGIPFQVVSNRMESEALLQKEPPDLCFVCGWYWLITKQTLDAVPAGFIGIHFSLLPKYRGGSPLVWTMINGDQQAGLSMFSFTEGVDTGPLWAQRSVTVGPEEAIGSVLERLEAESVDVIRQTYPGILRGTIQPVEQDPAGATYCAMRNPGDGEIDWQAPAAHVHNFIRAQSRPYPGAFTLWQGEKLVIWSARLCGHPYYGTPGQVARVAGEGVYVVCGDQRAIIVQSVEWKGITQPAAQALKSVQIRFPRFVNSKG